MHGLMDGGPKARRLLALSVVVRSDRIVLPVPFGAEQQRDID